jgi:hypothetical protein
MAVRGGKGGDPVAFSGGSGEGNGGGSGRGTTTGASDNPYEGHDYEGEWAEKGAAGKLRPENRPSIPGSVDRDGLDKGNRAEIEHHTKRQRAFDDAYVQQQANRPKTTKKVEPRIPRISADEKATVKGKRLENPTGTKEFAALLDLHSATIKAGLSTLNAKEQVGSHGPRRLSLIESKGKEVLMTNKNGEPVTSGGNLVKVNAASQALAAANNHYSKYTEHRMAGEDFRFGTNNSGENPTKMRSSVDTHKWYKKAANSLLTAHTHMNHESITAVTGAAANLLSENTITEFQNKADKLPVQKVGEQPTQLQFGAKKFEKHIREHLVKSGISEGSKEWTEAMGQLKGNIKLGSTIHKILIDGAKDYHERTGDDSPLKKLTEPLKPVRKLTPGEKARAKVSELGFGSLKGGTKTLDDLNKSAAAASEAGQDVDKPVSQILDETDHGIDTRIADPKRASSESTRTDRVGSAPIKGPTIGVNVTNVEGKGKK